MVIAKIMGERAPCSTPNGDDNMPGDELNAKEAAEYLDISLKTLYTLVKRGLVKRYERPFGRGLGGERVYYKRPELAALLKRKK